MRRLKRTWAYNHEFSFLLWTWIKSLTIQLQHPRKIAYIWQIKRVQNNAIKFERTQIHFLATFSLPSLSSLLKLAIGQALTESHLRHFMSRCLFWNSSPVSVVIDRPFLSLLHKLHFQSEAYSSSSKTCTVTIENYTISWWPHHHNTAGGS